MITLISGIEPFQKIRKKQNSLYIVRSIRVLSSIYLDNTAASRMERRQRILFYTAVILIFLALGKLLCRLSQLRFT